MRERKSSWVFSVWAGSCDQDNGALRPANAPYEAKHKLASDARLRSVKQYAVLTNDAAINEWPPFQIMSFWRRPDMPEPAKLKLRRPRGDCLNRMLGMVGLAVSGTNS